MKKKTTVLLTFIAIILLLTACGKKQHEHTAGEIWTIDHINHMHICTECGEEFDKAEHTLEDITCTVCKAEIHKNDDGTTDAYGYDQFGSLCFNGGYGENGELLYEIKNVYEYDESGNVTNGKYYYDGVLTGEDIFLPTVTDEVAEIYLSESISYNDDGTKSITKYAENGEIISSSYVDADGNTTETYTYEKEFDDNGNITKQTTYLNGVIYSEDFYVNTEDHSYVSKQIFYDENGQVKEEYNYDEDGNLQ